MEITGRLTADATVRSVKGDKEVVSFSIAINDSYRPKGSTEKKKLTTYINCSYWLNSATAKVLRKGAIVEVSGRIGMNVYNNMDGQAVGSLTFHVNNVKVTAYAKREETAEQPQGQYTPQATGSGSQVDDLPF